MLDLYPLLRPALPLIDAEKGHRLALWALRNGLLRPETSTDDPVLTTSVLGRMLPNPIGLAAGFDKNAMVINATQSMGFGFIEIGGVTPRPQTGNPRPRLFRLSEDHGVINRMGFNNDGMEAIAYLSGQSPFNDRAKYPMPTIILMDLKMPRRNGFEVLEWMHNQPEIKLIPTIVVTSSTLQEDVTRAYRLGANAVMNKPVDKDSLLQMLKSFHIYWTDFVEMPEVKASTMAD